MLLQPEEEEQAVSKPRDTRVKGLHCGCSNVRLSARLLSHAKEGHEDFRQDAWKESAQSKGQVAK